MSSSVTLSAGVRSNLLALQDTTNLQATTQQRLATGKKVNSALDNPTNFFTAAALSARARRRVAHPPRLDDQRYQHAQGRRQRPDVDHHHHPVDASERHPGPSGRFLAERALLDRL